MTGALACARNTEDADTDETAAARDTTVTDTLGQVQNPPGYRGMERDTTLVPEQEGTDTFLQNQGTGQAQDTAGYTGMERVDTTGQQGQVDTTGWQDQQGQTDTTGWQNQQDQTDTTGWQNQQGQADTTGGAWGADTSGAYGTGTDSVPTGDTTGYDPAQ
jgi:hypothetical protein